MTRGLSHLLAACLVCLVCLAGCRPAPNALTDSSQLPSNAADMPPPVPPAVLAQAQALIGLQKTPRGFRGQVPNVACEHLGDAGTMGAQRDWSYRIFICMKHTVIVLAKRQSGQYEEAVFKIVDVLAIPEILPPLGETDPEPFPWRLSGHMANDGCDVEGYSGDDMPMVFGLSRRQELPVVKLAQAWTFDFQNGKIVPFDPSKVECDYVEP